MTPNPVPPPPPGSQLPALSLEDVVPLLRSDLSATRDPANGNLQHVSEPVRGQSFPLQDFEVSIARMLDGQRRVVDVIDAAAQIGIPLSLESFRNFLAKLRSYGFVEEPRLFTHVAAPAKGSRNTWPPRSAWSESERQLFQQALRAVRADDFGQAKQLVGQLLQLQPRSPEVLDLETQIDNAVRARASGQPTPSFAQVYSNSENTWFEAGERPPEATPGELPEDDDEAPAKSRKGLIAGVAAAALLGTSLIPVSREASGPVQISAIRQVPIRLPHSGVLSEVVVKVGQTVKKGEVVARFDLATAKQQLARSDAHAAELKKQLKRLTADARSPKLAKAKAKQQKLQSELKRAEADRDRAKRAKKRPALAKAEKKAAALEAQLKRATAEVEGFSKSEDVDRINTELRATAQEHDALVAELAAPVLTSPESGVVLQVPTKLAQPLSADEEVGKIEDANTVKLSARFGPETKAWVEKGQAMVVDVGTRKVNATVLAVASEGKEVVAQSEVANTDGSLKPGAAATAHLTGSTQPLFKKLLGL